MVLIFIFVFADIIGIYSHFVDSRDQYENLTFENATMLDTYSSIPKIKECENELVDFLNKNNFQIITIDEKCQKENNTSLLITAIDITAKKEDMNYNIVTKFKRGIMCNSLLKVSGILINYDPNQFDLSREYLDPLFNILDIKDGYSLFRSSYRKIEKKRNNVYSYVSNNEYHISLSIQQTDNDQYYYSYIISY